MRADENRYKDALKDLTYSACCKRNECLTTLTTDFELLIRDSGIFDKNACRNFRGNHTGRGGGRSIVMLAQAVRGIEGMEFPRE